MIPATLLFLAQVPDPAISRAPVLSPKAGSPERRGILAAIDLPKGARAISLFVQGGRALARISRRNAPVGAMYPQGGGLYKATSYYLVRDGVRGRMGWRVFAKLDRESEDCTGEPKVYDFRALAGAGFLPALLDADEYHESPRDCAWGGRFAENGFVVAVMGGFIGIRAEPVTDAGVVDGKRAGDTVVWKRREYRLAVPTLVVPGARSR